MRLWCLWMLGLLTACGALPLAQPTLAPPHAPTSAVQHTPNPTTAPTVPATSTVLPSVARTAVVAPSTPPSPATGAVERILFTAEADGFTQLFAIAPNGSNEVTLSPPDANVWDWAFAPDQRQIALALRHGETSDIMIIASDGSSAARTLARGQPNASELTWSPDGARIAFVVAPDGYASGANEDIYAVSVSDGSVAQLTRDPLPEVNPVGSPDGTLIAFERGNYAPTLEDNRQRVFVMRADGVDAHPLTPPEVPSYNPRWSADGSQLTLVVDGTPPHRATVRADGSQLSDDGPLPALYATPDSYQFTSAPDEQHIAFMRQDGECQVEQCTRHIYVADASNNVRQLTQGATSAKNDSLLNEDPVWSPDGARLLFLSNRDGDIALYTMHADGSDQQRLTPRNVDLGRAAWLRLPAAPIAFGPSGFIAVVTTLTDQSTSDIYLFPAQGGKPRRVSSSPANDYAPAWSPDGTQIAFVSDRDGGPSLYLTNTEGSTLKRLASGTRDAPISSAAWSPDGQTLVYDHNCSLETVRADGSATRPLLAPAEGQDACFTMPTWSPDGNTVIFAGTIDSSRSALFAIPVKSGIPMQITDTVGAPGSEQTPAWSPDGTRIAFSSMRDGVAHIYVADANGHNPVRLTERAEPEFNPTWSPDGHWIAFDSDVAGRSSIYAVAVETGTVTSLDNLVSQTDPNWSAQ